MSAIRRAAFEPLITAPLLLALTRSQSLRSALVSLLSRLPAPLRISPDTVRTALKWLLALGLTHRLSRALDARTLNGGAWTAPGAAWDWPSEVAVITGGSSGIGAAMARILAPRLAAVAVLDVQPLPADLAALPNVRLYTCDVTDPDAVAAAAAAVAADLPTPTVLVNNAGIAQGYTILEQPPAELRRILDLNLASHWHTVRAFLPGMLRARKGHVVSVASRASFSNMAGGCAYCVSKAGVMSFHEGLSQELRHVHKAPFVKTSIVHPTWVRTPILGDALEAKLERQQAAGKGLPLFDAEYVAGEVCGAILGQRRHGQIIIPGSVSFLRCIRALPWWLQERARDRGTLGVMNV